jgi:putative ATPase
MTQTSLFESSAENQKTQPLAALLRPRKISEILGQEKILGPKSSLYKNIQKGFVPNLILWGPPGSGKTTLALAIAREIHSQFIQLNAVEAGVKDLKQAGEQGRSSRLIHSQRTIVFIDEIHRLNKGQQDVLLPHLETGDLILIGATTENPSYELNRALLSRSQVLVLNALDEVTLRKIFENSLDQLGIKSAADLLEESAIEFLLNQADGDARRLLNMVEILSHARLAQDKPMTTGQVQETLGQRVLSYDKNSEYHYDLISAFIKSVRGSDADAALYYMVRMLKGGESPLFICRRMIILASEDIGNADPRAIQVAVATLQAVEAIGLPEGEIPMAQCVTYLASCPKSNRAYMALHQAQAFVDQTGNLPVPLHLRSSKTALAKQLGYGKDYIYTHDYPKSWTEQNYWPETTQPQTFYEPSQNGFEKQICEFQKWQKEK